MTDTKRTLAARAREFIEEHGAYGRILLMADFAKFVLREEAEILETDQLSAGERIELFTLLQQWSRNQELQATKIAEWYANRQKKLAHSLRTRHGLGEK